MFKFKAPLNSIFAIIIVCVAFTLLVWQCPNNSTADAAKSGVANMKQANPGDQSFRVIRTAEETVMSSSTLYTIQAGDTLYLIAQKFHVTVNDLMTANSLQSDLIRTGAVLTIPSNTSNTLKYTVKPGDCLYAIAMIYGVTVSGLQQSNGLSGDLIYPGQILNIPGGTAAVPTPTPTPTPSPTPAPTPSPTPAPVAEPLKQILQEKGITSYNKLSIVVTKSQHTLAIEQGGAVLKTYHVTLSPNPADKRVAGDLGTPEGTFYIAERSILQPADEYLGTRWFRLSYPNVEDADRGLSEGLIDQATHDQIAAAIANLQIPPQNTALGGGVGVHGGDSPAMGPNWTWGCVALTNSDIEDFFDYISVGTPIVINS